MILKSKFKTIIQIHSQVYHRLILKETNWFNKLNPKDLPVLKRREVQLQELKYWLNRIKVLKLCLLRPI